MSHHTGLFAHAAEQLIDPSMFDFGCTEGEFFDAREFSSGLQKENGSTWYSTETTKNGISLLVELADHYKNITSATVNKTVDYKDNGRCNGCCECIEGVRSQTLICKFFFTFFTFFYF